MHRLMRLIDFCHVIDNHQLISSFLPIVISVVIEK